MVRSAYSAHNVHSAVEARTPPRQQLVRELATRLDALPDNVFRDADLERLAARMVSVIPAASPADRDVGPFYRTAALIDWLGISRQAINARVKDGTLLGLPTADGPLAYPTWQFTDSGAVVPHLAEVLGALAVGTDDQWAWAAWLVAQTPERFGNRPAWEWLAQGRDAGVVVDAARHDAAVWAR